MPVDKSRLAETPPARQRVEGAPAQADTASRLSRTRPRLAVAPAAGNSGESEVRSASPLPEAHTGVGDCAGAVRRVLAGDREAYRLLVETHEPAVLGLCRRRVGGDASEAEDVCQETFVRAYFRLEQLADPARFAPWVFQIARSLCLERLRRREAERRALAGRVERLEAEARGATGGPEVGSLLAELPTEEREILELRYFEGLSYKELQARLGWSFSRVDHLIRKARARLERRVQARIDRDGSL